MLHAARWKFRTQKIAVWAPSQLCWAISLQLRHVSTIGKNLLNSNIFPTCPHIMLTSADYRLSLGHPSKFQRVSRLGFFIAAPSLNGGQPNFAQCLAVSWACTLYVSKTSHLWFAITLTHMNAFLVFFWQKCYQ